MTKIDSQTSIRFDWIDVLKFLGIFAIYLGHHGQSAGKLYTFVFQYHVALFFFVSGFFASKNLDTSFSQYVFKKFKQIMIPYYFFALISILSFAFVENMSAMQVFDMSKNYIYGIRNTLSSASLWFLPCIFIISILYFSLKKLVRNKYLFLIIVSTIFFMRSFILPDKPSWFFNLDSALYYLIFYYLGDISFAKIVKFNFTNKKIHKKITLILFALLSVLVTIITYFKESGYIIQLLYSILPLNLFSWLFTPIISLYITLSIIFVNILLSILFRKVKLFQELGANTLSLCGTENIVVLYLKIILSMIGLNLTLNSPLACIFFSFICLIISNQIRLKIINPYFPNLLNGR